MKSIFNGYPFIFRKKGKEKIPRIRDNGFSITVDNGASLMLVGLAAFFCSLLRDDPLGSTSVPPPPRYALRLISWGGLRKSPCDNRDFTLRRAIRAGARSSRILSAFFFIYIELFAESGTYSNTMERLRERNASAREPRENELVKLRPFCENKSSIKIIRKMLLYHFCWEKIDLKFCY